MGHIHVGQPGVAGSVVFLSVPTPLLLIAFSLPAPILKLLPWQRGRKRS